MFKQWELDDSHADTCVVGSETALMLLTLWQAKVKITGLDGTKSANAKTVTRSPLGYIDPGTGDRFMLNVFSSSPGFPKMTATLLGF